MLISSLPLRKRETGSYGHYIRSDVIGIGVGHLQGDPKEGNQLLSSGGEGRKGVWGLEGFIQSNV